MQRREFLTLTAASFCAPALIDALHADEPASLPKNVHSRGSYANSKRVFETTRKGRVAFMGGSITEMEGYRPMVCDYLHEKFPETEFDFVAAGISSTNSDVGAYRLEADVIQGQDVDLFFVEFAANDNQDGMFDVEHSLRGMEGIVRHIRTACPNVDIVMTFFVNEDIMQKYREGNPAPSIRAHNAVAERYAVSVIDLAKEIQEQIDSKRLTWEEFGGVHPAPRGNRICADMIAALLDDAWRGPTAEALAPHDMPEPIDKYSYANGGFRGFDGVETEGGFDVFVPDWSKIPGAFRERFAGVPCLCADTPGAEATFEFTGNAVALYILAGPDAGIVETQLDGGAWKKVDAYHDYSAGLHYPRGITLADGLENGKHTAKIRISEEKNEQSAGTALRVMHICVNQGL